MKNRLMVVCRIASLMLMVHGPLLALGGGVGVGVGGFHGGSIGNAGHVTNPDYYPGGYWGYAMGPTTVEGDQDLNAGRESAPPVAGTGTGGGPPEELEDGRGIHVRQHEISEEGATWDSDWWAQDPRSADEKAAAAERDDASPGAAVSSLPRFYDTVYAADGRYYFAQGKFYQATESGYQVVSPPIGIEVQQLPSKAEMVKVKGQQYFVYQGIYYQALYSGSGIVYRVVEEPTP